MAAFFQQLRSREVFRVAVAYLSVAWLTIGALDVVSEPLGIPLWVSRVAIYSLIAGLPIALVLSWLYRLTPEGRIERESDEQSLVPAAIGSRKIDFVIIGTLALAVVFLLIGDRPGSRVTGAGHIDNGPTVTSIKKLSNTQIFLPPVSSPFPLVVDSSRIYFNHFPDEVGAYRVGQMARAGGDLLQFEMPFDYSTMGASPDRLSPDKSAVILNVFDRYDYNAPPEIWEMPIAGGSPRKITDGYQSALSPDGKTLAFRRDWRNLYIANADASDARKVFSAEGMSIYWLRFSPDGKRLRFTVFLDHFAGEIWEYSIGEDTVYPVMPEWRAKDICCGSWTPDGKYYVFEATHDAGPQIWAVRDTANGDDPKAEPFRLTSGALDFKRPTIPEDGNKIYAIGWQLRGEVVEKSIEDDRFHAIEGLESMSIEHVDFSKDGKLVAYVSYPEGHLWTKDLSTGRSNQLTFGYTRVSSPKISSDGSTIAYEAWVQGEKRKVFVIDVAGGDSMLVSNPETHSGTPSWSPDGTKLMLSEDSDKSPRIFDMLLAITTDLGLAEPIYGAIWSPDGVKLAGRYKRNVVVYRFDTGFAEVVAENTSRRVANWADDSNRIYLVDPWSVLGARSAYSLDIRNSRITKIAELGRERPVWGTKMWWAGITPHGTVMLLRDHSIHNIYALDWKPE